jgi:protein-S-isoprenylcysteine O-methyltransferase Ste14
MREKQPLLDAPDIVALPPLIWLGALLLAVLLEWLLPVGLLPPPLSPAGCVPGGLLLAAGVGIALSGAVAFRRAGTNVHPRHPALVLVETGPYRFTRNPMYLGLLVCLAGIGLVASLDWAIPMVLPLWLVLHRGVVLREEAYLSAKFGAPYDAFLARTRRWL